VVTVTDNSFDTGERRRVGSYETRHIKATMIIDPSERTGMKPGKVEFDGWYIDLPGWDMCEDNQRGFEGYYLSIETDGPRPASGTIWHQHGPRRGLVIEENTKTTPGVGSDGTIEFLGISEQPLDPALFEVPRDYVHKE
jgi:hypothetical protein